MKKIGIVSMKSELAELLEHELNFFLKGKADFVRYIVKDERVSIDEADVILLSGEFVAKYVVIPQKEKIPILSPRRTLTMEGWERLKSLKSGIPMLLVNDSKESAEEVVLLTKELGLDLDLHIYYPSCKDFPRLETAITPGETRFVPSFVKNVIDIHDRIFDPSVILELLFRLNLFEWEDLNKIIEYSKTVKSTQPGLQRFLLDMATVKLDLETVLSMTKQAVIAYSKEDGKILLFNYLAEKYLGQIGIGKEMHSIFQKMGLKYVDRELYNEIIEMNDAEMIVNSKEVPGGTMMISFYPVDLYRDVERKHAFKIKKAGMVAKIDFNAIVGGSKIQDVVKLAKKMAISDMPILLEGESGTGKELFAQAIHNYSKRSDGPFVPVNCAALSEELLESELFGYEEGAFTGAKKGGKAGLFEIANNGTIFLDEISEIPFELQSKLLRVLQEKEIIKVGGTNVIPVNVRIISATNMNLFEMMEVGKFRMDLFYRISTFQLHIPTLRERIDDLDLLLKYFVSKKGYDIYFDPELVSLLKKHSWPGNGREVENFVDYTGNLFSGAIGINEIPPYLSKKIFEGIDVLNHSEIEVLKFLHENRNSGRSKIAKMCHIKENEVRKILSHLKSLGYISVNVGRIGASVSELGYQFLSTVNKQY